MAFAFAECNNIVRIDHFTNISYAVDFFDSWKKCENLLWTYRPLVVGDSENALEKNVIS